MTKNFSNIIKVSQSNINSLQSLLLKSKFELLEIWTPDSGEEKQVWFNTQLNTKLTLIVKNEEELLSTNKQIVSEVTDLWFELRAIRDVLEQEYLLPELNLVDENESSFQKYQNKVEEYQCEWNENKQYMSKLFNKSIDPSILAFLNLEEADKQNYEYEDGECVWAKYLDYPWWPGQIEIAANDTRPKNKRRKIIFKMSTGLSTREKLSIVGKLIGRSKLDKETIYQGMVDINADGVRITTRWLAEILGVSKRTIYRHMCEDLKREKKILNEEL